MNKKFIVLLGIACLVITLLGCSDSTSKLEDKKWYLQSYDGQNLIEDTEITATFDGDKGEISGSAGCNTYFAAYEVKGDKLTVSQMAWTEMACLNPEGVMDQEQEYLSLLGTARSFKVSDTGLTIDCVDGKQLKYSASAE